MNKFDAAANIALFLTEKTGSACGSWTGKMKAADQRAMFGAFLGKGQIKIDGSTETIEHVVSACFGLDYDVTFSATWSTIGDKVAAHKANDMNRRKF